MFDFGTALHESRWQWLADIKFPKSNFLISLHALRHRKFGKHFGWNCFNIHEMLESTSGNKFHTQNFTYVVSHTLSIRFRMHNVLVRRRKMLHYVFLCGEFLEKDPKHMRNVFLHGCGIWHRNAGIKWFEFAAIHKFFGTQLEMWNGNF
jgi:hypothetical protein